MYIVLKVTKVTRWMITYVQTRTDENFTTTRIFLRPRWMTAHAQMFKNVNFTTATI